MEDEGEGPLKIVPRKNKELNKDNAKQEHDHQRQDHTILRHQESEANDDKYDITVTLKDCNE